MDNTAAHSDVENMACAMPVSDGIATGSRISIIRLAPYGPMPISIEACWSAVNAQMKPYLASRMTEFFVRGHHEFLDTPRMDILREAALECNYIT